VSQLADAKDTGPARQALTELEQAVGRVLEEMESLRGRVKESESRTRNVEELLRRFTKGEVDPGNLQERLSELEEVNQGLLDRIDSGKVGVERVLARIRFLEEHR
jgi:hypothetical protein